MLAALCFIALLPMLQAQTELGSPQEGCTANSRVDTCDKALFLKALADAKTVIINTQPSDGVAVRQLSQMAKEMGKAVQPPSATADMVFVFQRIGMDGVVLIGPGGGGLARLSIYGPTDNGARGRMLWSETFSGPEDMAWPAVVRSVIQQLQERIAKR